MPTQIEKLEAHASHLLDGCINLKEKYALLDPMLFSPEVPKTYGSKKQARGFKILRHSLFLSCAQDIAKFCLDDDRRTPSIRNLVSSLEDSTLRNQLKERYAILNLSSIEEESDPEIIEVLKRREEQEQTERRELFEKQYSELIEKWQELSSSQTLDAFVTIRDKVSAHTEVQFVADKYHLVDIGELGIKWGDIKSTIDAMKELVELLGYIIRNAGFAWEMLDEQLIEASNGFWSVSEKES